jgi:60 kDa SS-A/Ro ribonucleoprotein
MCLTSFIEDWFYEKAEDKIKRIQEYVKSLDVNFVLKLAIFSRQYWLRTINHILFVEVVKKLVGTKGIRSIVNNCLDKMIRRPDELMSIVWYYSYSTKQNLNSVILPNSLKVWIKKRLERFNDYQIAKYKWSGDVNLFDLINITHPKSESITRLMKGTLPPADTWEVELSKNGNNKETWERLMSEDKLWALATIRNLRNMVKVWVDPVPYLEKIKWSDIFPFQAIQAIDALEQENMLSWPIHDTVLKNVKKSFEFISKAYDWKIAIGIDLSWSMYGTSVSKLSKLDLAKMACYYWALLSEVSEKSDLFLWWSNCEKVDNRVSISDLLQRWKGGTNISSFTNMIKDWDYDYAIILTDWQIGDHCKNEAKKTIIWNLSDYSNTISDKWNWVVEFSWYNDLMWKIASDISDLGKIEKAITNN